MALDLILGGAEGEAAYTQLGPTTPPNTRAHLQSVAKAVVIKTFSAQRVANLLGLRQFGNLNQMRDMPLALVPIIYFSSSL